MSMLILDPFEVRELIEKREATGADRYDEVWEGVYIVSPPPNDEHQEIVTDLSSCFYNTIKSVGLGQVRSGVGVSDREAHWDQNYRVPDVSVYLNGTKARNVGTHWVGGPDFAVEVVSRYDRSREKFAFYSGIGTRELLIVDRFPWSIELYRLTDGVLTLVGKSDLKDPAPLASLVLPLAFRLVAGGARPTIEVAHADGVQRWTI